MCLSENTVPGFSGPMLAGLRPSWSSPGPLLRRFLIGIYNTLSLRFAAGLFPQQSRRVISFLNGLPSPVVLAEYGPTGCYLLDSCLRTDTPLYVHFHGYDASLLMGRELWLRHYRRLFQLCDGVIVPSVFLRSKLVAAGCDNTKISVCPCGIDPEFFATGSQRPSGIVAVGRLVPKKAPLNTIKAFGLIAERFPQTRLHFIGDGPLLEACRDGIAALGLQRRVLLYGAQDHENVARFMSEAAIFVQHSVTAANGDTEGLPVSMLEAMAAGLPVVSTRHAGISEAVVGGVTGLLVEEHDIDAMAAAMAELLNDPARAGKMGKAGRERVLKNFTLEKSAMCLRSAMKLTVDSSLR
ncbi:glycosyltransferase [Oricola cellulosilytica]|nr:glycosyltransferase [Oricola cellulosilytica]